MAKRSRLTRSDFPDDRRYSRERLWAHEFPDGTMRIGLALPAIQEETPGVYFIDLRQSGYIQTGKKFGFIDIDTGRFDLVAPLSGRVGRVNPALATDPGLVAIDCYGEGWLYEVTRVLPQAFQALLDRDSFYGWLKFEREARRLGLDPTVSSTQRFVEGEPWPQEIVFRLGGRVVVRSRPVRLGRNESFTPQWTVGQSWVVKTEFDQPSMAMVENPPDVHIVRKWRYEVVDEYGEVRGEPCWVVKVTELEGPPPLKFHLLSIARSDFSLRMIEEVNTYDAAARSRFPNDWGAEGYVELRRPRELIVDLPLFPSENLDERRVVAVGAEPKYTVEAKFPDAKRMCLAVDARTARGDPVRSEQTWERGLPWWREARRVSGEKVLIKGELLQN